MMQPSGHLPQPMITWPHVRGAVRLVCHLCRLMMAIVTPRETRLGLDPGCQRQSREGASLPSRSRLRMISCS
jgi:hypothetical protein